MLAPNRDLKPAVAAKKVANEAIALDGTEDFDEPADDILGIEVSGISLDKRRLNPLKTNRYAGLLRVVGASNQTGVVDERPDPMKDDGALRDLFMRADEIASTTLKGRPPKGHDSPEKKTVTVRLEQEVLDWLNKRKSKTSAQVNAFLRAMMEAETETEDKGAAPSPE